MAFQEAGRVLRRGGWFLIVCEASNPDNEVWTSRIEGMTVYAPDELEQRLTAAGFTDISLYRRGGEDVCITARKR